jgi:hypothetical protein
MRSLLDGGFLERTENVLVFGNPGSHHCWTLVGLREPNPRLDLRADRDKCFAVFSQEFPGAHQGNGRFFSARGDNSASQLTLPNIKNRVGRVALRVGRLIFFQGDNFPAQNSSREKGRRIENRNAIYWLRLGRSKPRRFFKFGCGGVCGPHGAN